MGYAIYKVTEIDKYNEVIKAEYVFGDESMIDQLIDNNEEVKVTYVQSSNLKLEVEPKAGLEEEVDIRFNYRKKF